MRRLTIKDALKLGAEAHKSGKAKEADRYYTAILQAQPNHPEANHNKGVLAFELAEVEKSIIFIEHAIKNKPGEIKFWLSLINVFSKQKKLDEANSTFVRAKKYFANTETLNLLELEIRRVRSELATNMKSQSLKVLKKNLSEKFKKKEFASIIKISENMTQEEIKSSEVYYIFGTAAAEHGNLENAIYYFKKSMEYNADNPDTHFSIGNIYRKTGQLDYAEKSYRKALIFNKNYAEIHNNLGETLREQGRLEESITSFRRAIEISPNLPEAFYNLGNSYRDKKKYQNALNSYENAIKLKPDYAKAFNNIADIYKNNGKLDTALANCTLALKFKPNFAEALSQAYFISALIADWGFIKKIEEKLSSLTLEGNLITYGLLAQSDNPSVHLARAKLLVTSKYTKLENKFDRIKRDSNRIRVGYFSSYFRQHPVSLLSAGVFENHNKNKFEIFAFHYGPDNGDGYNMRIKDAFENYYNVSGMTDQKIAEFAIEKKLDIAIDLNGFMKDGRIGILARRVAPIQVNYLAYPSTMGAKFIDYIIADNTVIPLEQRQNYSEKIIFLPNCYMPQDDARYLPDKTFSRTDFGLPKTGFIFCCFNNSFKISEVEFDIWMSLLWEVEGSVLWLLKANEWFEKNIKFEAQKRGVDPNRLVFADQLENETHLARIKLANLFLDTFNFNAHTTASDALWVGLPIVTKLGKSFPSRVAASLLLNLDVPELITYSDLEYKKLALGLAKNHKLLDSIKSKILKNRKSTPLFDTKSYTQNLEKAYLKIYQRYLDGAAPIELELK